jgi:hypothetical protein
MPRARPSAYTGGGLCRGLGRRRTGEGAMPTAGRARCRPPEPYPLPLAPLSPACSLARSPACSLLPAAAARSQAAAVPRSGQPPRPRRAARRATPGQPRAPPPATLLLRSCQPRAPPGQPRATTSASRALPRLPGRRASTPGQPRPPATPRPPRAPRPPPSQHPRPAAPPPPRPSRPAAPPSQHLRTTRHHLGRAGRQGTCLPRPCIVV